MPFWGAKCELSMSLTSVSSKKGMYKPIFEISFSSSNKNNYVYYHILKHLAKFCLTCCNIHCSLIIDISVQYSIQRRAYDLGHNSVLHIHTHTQMHTQLVICLKYFEKKGNVLVEDLNYNNSRYYFSVMKIFIMHLCMIQVTVYAVLQTKSQ